MCSAKLLSDRFAYQVGNSQLCTYHISPSFLAFDSVNGSTKQPLRIFDDYRPHLAITHSFEKVDVLFETSNNVQRLTMTLMRLGFYVMQAFGLPLPIYHHTSINI